MLRLTRTDWAFSFLLITAAASYQFGYVSTLHVPQLFFYANTAVLIGCTSLAIFGSPHRFSPYQSIMIFYAIFFGLIPPLHLSAGISHWGASLETLEFYEPAMVLALLCLMAFHAAYRWGLRGYRSSGEVAKVGISSSHLLLISAGAGLIILIMNRFSLGSLFVRTGPSKTLLEIGQIGHLIYQYFVFPIPSLAFILYLCHRPVVSKVAVVLALTMLVFNSPTSMARFQAAALYIEVLYAAFPHLMRFRTSLPLALLFGIVLIFPTLEIFRNFNISAPTWRMPSMDALYGGTFDSFQSLAGAMASGAVVWGYNLLGAALFFVPRSIWADKPIGSGAALAEQEGYSFSNVSMNFIGEGYVSFGIFGALLIMLVAGWLIGWLDRRRNNQFSNPTFKAQYLLSVGLVFFMSRGDLLSSFAFSTGMLLSCWIVAELCKVRWRTLRTPPLDHQITSL